MTRSGPRVARLATLAALSLFALGLLPSSAAAKTHHKGTPEPTLTAPSGEADASAAGDGTGSACTFGTFSATNLPGPCWRPYADSSPFNTPVPANAPIVSNSAALVANLNGGPGQRTFGDPDRHPSSPNFYWSSPTDPLACWHAFGAYGQPYPRNGYDAEGVCLPVPANAQPSGGWATCSPCDHDAQMTVIDESALASPAASGGASEYHSWQCRNRTTDVPSTIWCRGVDSEPLAGDGIYTPGQNAANFGGLAGLVRPEEFMGNHIDHALIMAVSCSGSHVYPALGTGSPCSDPSKAIPLGTHFQLNPEYVIPPTGLPDWKVAMLQALKKYGAYVSDTECGGCGTSRAAIEFEGEGSYTYMGYPDPYLAWLTSQGIPLRGTPPHQYAWLDLGAGWDHSQLRVVGICAAQGAC